MKKLQVKKISGFQKLRGLIAYNKPEAICFTTRFGIHTFGVMVPIDVVILDTEHKVVTLKKDLNPNRFFFWNPVHKIVLELPSGTISKLKIEYGDILSVETKELSHLQGN